MEIPPFYPILPYGRESVKQYVSTEIKASPLWEAGMKSKIIAAFGYIITVNSPHPSQIGSEVPICATFPQGGR
jgi:hypothetical protein